MLIACHSEREWAGVRRAFGFDAAGWPLTPRPDKLWLDRCEAGLALTEAARKLSTLELQRRLQDEDVPCAIPASCNLTRLANDAEARRLGITTV